MIKSSLDFTTSSSSSFCPIAVGAPTLTPLTILAATSRDNARCIQISAVIASVASSQPSIELNPSPLYNFEINPNTSTFPLTYIAATIALVAFMGLRYYRPRQQNKDVCTTTTTTTSNIQVGSVNKPLISLSESKPTEHPVESQILAEPIASEEKKDTIDTFVYEHPSKGTIPRAAKLSSETMVLTAQPIIKNSMSEMNDAVMNGMQVNSSGRHRQCKVSRRLSRPSFEHLVEEIRPESTTVTPTSAVSTTLTTTPTTTTVATPTKTMKELLEECEDDDFSSYGMAMHSVIKGGHNKTFSPQALKRMMSSPKSTTGAGTGAASDHGVVVSRASSMRDSKRRIGLDAVRFEDPNNSNRNDHGSKPQHSTPTVLALVQEQCSVDEGVSVILRQRPSRLSMTRSGFNMESNKASLGRSSNSKIDHDFGTIRMVRGVA